MLKRDQCVLIHLCHRLAITVVSDNNRRLPIALGVGDAPSRSRRRMASRVDA
jgi:hypothetical protein